VDAHGVLSTFLLPLLQVAMKDSLTALFPVLTPTDPVSTATESRVDLKDFPLLAMKLLCRATSASITTFTERCYFTLRAS
jgi:hypothetical protein